MDMCQCSCQFDNVTSNIHWNNWFKTDRSKSCEKDLIAIPMAVLTGDYLLPIFVGCTVYLLLLD